MNRAQYLIRFDDICPTINWTIWEKVEKILFDADIKPIIAVVPNNKDPKLQVDDPRSDFWKRLRYWQSLKWSIALHGYEHRFTTNSSGLLGLNNFSEFSGLPRDIQLFKLESAVRVFHENSINIDLWIAPAHSFDLTTVDLLLKKGIYVISDGFYWRVVKRFNAVWVPQQLWKFRRMPFGIWTVCFHPNTFTKSTLFKLSEDIKVFRSRIVDLPTVLKAKLTQKKLYDHLFHYCWLNTFKFKRLLTL
jgi:predicted deacetylase